MTHYCLDACSIINLFCGWGGIQELHSFGMSWSTTTTALGEFREVRVQQSDGSITRSPIEHRLILEQYPLTVHSNLGPEILATAATLSEEIDDGEAECLAVSLHRGLIFVSDDSLAVSAAGRLSVRAASSLDLISDWAELEPTRLHLLGEVLGRIETLARYVPPRSHPRRGWWDRIRLPGG
jgi:hypothetical protein